MEDHRRHVHGKRAVTNGEMIGVQAFLQDIACISTAMHTTYMTLTKALVRAQHLHRAVLQRSTEQCVSITEEVFLWSMALMLITIDVRRKNHFF